MHKARKITALLLALAMVVSIVALSGCGGGTTTTTTTTEPKTADFKLVKAGTLTVGSDTSFPPMESMNGQTAEGFDVDLMDAIGKELGLEVVFLTETFDTLIPTLKAGGKFDIVASGMTINDERKKEIDFTDPYFDSNQSIAMKVGMTYTDPTSLKGKKVGVQSGTTGMQWATENLVPAGASLVPFKTTTEAFSALQAGNVDAVVNDLPVTADIVKDPARGLVIVKQIPTGEQYGFAVSKDNAELTTAVNDALAKVKESGEYDAIYKKWIGEVAK